MTNDIIYITTWWLVFLVIGVVSFPLVWFFLRRFSDGGYGFTKIAGLILTSYTAFCGGTLKILPFKTINLYIILAAFSLLNLLIFSKHKNQILKTLTERKRIILAQEILFFLGLSFWSIIRGFQPDIRGLEKFMDFGFINSILKSDFFPPSDMWMAGKAINYYWFGHLFTAFATKISQIPSDITYNLMIATIAGFTLTEVFSIVSTFLLSAKIKKMQIVYLGAIASSFLVVFAGNFHAPFYILKDGTERYWYPDATRFIGYNPDVEDKTIHEFPIYSFVVSDLHAHLLNLPVVIFYLALLWNHFISINNKKKYLNHILMSFCLGVIIMTNTWDFANYSLLTFVISLVLTRKKFIQRAITMGAIGIGAIIFALPFLTHFSSITEGIKFVHSHSRIWQLAILWGFPAITGTIFFLILGRKRKIIVSDLFILGLFLTAFILVIIPEIIYVKDIYAASHYRANTMFKLTYQAFVVSYLSAGYVFVRTFFLVKKYLYKYILTTTYLLLASSVLIYPYFAIKSYYGELKTYHGLSGEKWLASQYPDQYLTLLWFRENVIGQPVILEAPGDSYTDYNILSAYSGLPTVQGWFVHEWLWRGKPEIPQARVNDVQIIYTSQNLNETRNLLHKYKVEYIVVGAFERQKYPNLNEQKFTQLGEPVFSAGQSRVYKVTVI